MVGRERIEPVLSTEAGLGDLGIPFAGAFQQLQASVGAGLQALLTGDWSALLGFVESPPDPGGTLVSEGRNADVLPI